MQRAIDRRTFIGASAACLLLAAGASRAQSERRGMRRIAFLGAADERGYASRIAALRAGLNELGYVEGRNLEITFRWAEGRYERLPALAAELARLDVEVIVTHAIPPTLAAKAATTTIPIVMTNVGDAVANGIVTNLARPEGNITGDTFFGPELAAKRLELLREALPRARRIGILLNPDNPGNRRSLPALEDAAASLGVTPVRVEARGAEAVADAIDAVAAPRLDALLVLEDVRFIAGVRRIADTVTARRLPVIGFTELAVAGGLIGYGADFLALYRRAATFVDRILKGARPADLPVERPTQFTLVYNAKAAQTLGIALPASFLVRAEVV
jgi:putative ABC transport system substrate-binding protein